MGYAALVTHRLNELYPDGSRFFAQVTAILIAYVGLYAVLTTRAHLRRNALLVERAERIKPSHKSLATQLAAHIVNLKERVEMLEHEHLPTERPEFGRGPAADSAAQTLAAHFAYSRESLAETKLQLQLAREIADSAPVPMIVTSSAGDVTYANNAFLEMLDVPLSSVVDVRWQQLVSAESREDTVRHWQQNVRNKARTVTGSVVYALARGNLKCLYRMVRVNTGYCGYIIPENAELLSAWFSSDAVRA